MQSFLLTGQKKKQKGIFFFLLRKMISSCSRCFKHEIAILSYSHIFFSCLLSSALSLQPFPQLCLLGQGMAMETLMKFFLLLPRLRVPSGILKAFLEELNALREKNKLPCGAVVLPNWTLISQYVPQGKKPPLTLCFCVCVYMCIWHLAKWSLNSDPNLKIGHNKSKSKYSDYH